MPPFMSGNYLAHYGRSKLDGAPVGSGRYPIGSGENPRAKALRKDGIEVGKSGVDVIKKGTVITRFADKGEGLDSHRKYASITKDDRETYEEYALNNMLRIEDPSTAQEYKYRAKKDMKVASGEKVWNDLMSLYGDLKVDSILHKEDYKKNKSKKFNSKIGFYYTWSKELERTAKKAIDEYGDLPIKDVIGSYKTGTFVSDSEYRKGVSTKAFVEDMLDKFVSAQYDKFDSYEIIDKYTKEGYGAVYDIMDKEVADYPIIVLNPAKTLELIESLDLVKQ